MLLDFVETKLDAQAIGDLLTMAGFELEGIEEVEGEPVLDMKVMSNRGDGLSVFGLSREVLAKDPESKPTDLYLRAAKRFAGSNGCDGSENPAKVTIETEDCTRYACRFWPNAPQGEAPALIQERLRKSGQRPISLLVDLTNYVMLELGQPLHAFDYQKLASGEIVVRKAKPGEKLTTLNGDEHELKPNHMMICDATTPVAVAGVMGGETSEVTDSTTQLLLESAHFVNTSVRKTRKQLGLNTDASYRFERSVDPEGVVAAIERFTELLGLPGSVLIDEYPIKPNPKPVQVSFTRASKLLGMEISAAQAKQYLERLGMSVDGNDDVVTVMPPTWRPDLIREEDFIEEIGRVHGFEKIPEALPFGTTTLGGPRGKLHQEEKLREAIVRLGFIQIVSHSLRDLHSLDATTERIGPREPAGPDLAYLRNSLLPSLAESAQRNGGRDIHLFEIGKVFSKDSSGYVERKSVALLSTGTLIPLDRKGEVLPNADFFVLKGVLEETLVAVGYPLVLETKSVDSRLHPTRQAQILIEGRVVGVMGQIHPKIADETKLPASTVLAELDVDLLLDGRQSDIAVPLLSRNPAVRRDIAVLVSKEIPFATLEDKVREGAGDVLEKLWLFDVYAGANLPEGMHSLGVTLQLRKHGQNFTDEEANQVREQVVQALATIGATTR